jgi:ankyrin repeat protein
MYDNITIPVIDYGSIFDITKNTDNTQFIIFGCAYASHRLLANSVPRVTEWRLGVFGTCLGGNIDIFRQMVKFRSQIESVEYEATIITGFLLACFYGNYELVKYMISNHREFIDVYDPYELIQQGFSEACYSGERDTIDLLLSYGVKSVNFSLRMACAGGHLDIVKFLIQKGAKDFQEAINTASLFGHISIVELLAVNASVDLNVALTYACSGGNLDVINRLIILGANDYNNGLCWACSDGHLHIVKRMIECGARNWRDGIVYACGSGHIDIAKYLKFKYGHSTNSRRRKNIRIKHI